jgi:hypothetical protein
MGWNPDSSRLLGSWDIVTRSVRCDPTPSGKGTSDLDQCFKGGGTRRTRAICARGELADRDIPEHPSWRNDPNKCTRVEIWHRLSYDRPRQWMATRLRKTRLTQAQADQLIMATQLRKELEWCIPDVKKLDQTIEKRHSERIRPEERITCPKVCLGRAHTCSWLDKNPLDR